MIVDELTAINQMVESLHKTTLIDPNASPLGNTIYKLYADGEITHEKGGWAYGRRSMFTVDYPLTYSVSPFVFPCKQENHSFAIMTLDECKRVRAEMAKYLC